MKYLHHLHRVDIVGSGSQKKYTGKYGTTVQVDLDYDAILSKDYDEIIVPGGWVFILAKVAKGYKMTCVNAIIDDIIY